MVVMKRRSALGEAARWLALGGGVILFISLFLPWGVFGGSENAFQLFERDQYFLLAVALVVVAGAILDMFSSWRGFVALAGLFGATALGGLFFEMLAFKFSHLSVGWWVGLFSSAAAGVAGGLAILDLATQAEPMFSAPTGPGAIQTHAPGQAAAGWYPDPWGAAANRYWSGTDWTDQTSS
jgi:hypothetical protein